MTFLLRPGLAEIINPAGANIFDTGARPLTQVPGAAITVTAGGGSGPLPSGIVFPDMDKGYTYSYNSEPYTGLGGARLTAEGCVSCGRLLPQEWGPAGLGYIAPHVLPDIDLGAAPDWADFLELTHDLTQHPPSLPAGPATAPLFNPWPCEITSGATMDCEDGCCVVEAMAGLARQFWVEIVSGRIVLRRQQSVTGATAVPAGSGNPAYPGLLTHVLDARQGGSAGTGSMNLGQGSACSISNTADYTSSYTGMLTITPVNYHA